VSSSRRASAQQVEDPESNAHYCQKEIFGQALALESFLTCRLPLARFE
jgi:hypothetical protein